nr:HXXEE domain-containing protein [uncultured Clostridium sp.]
MLEISIKYYVASIIVIYFPFHLLEEAIGNFPNWMKEHKWMPEKLTYGHWMANNVFFYYSLLLAGFICYVLLGEKFAFMGIGILVWGLINCLDHLVYTIIDRKVSPGLFTGLLYLIVFLLGLLSLCKSQAPNIIVIVMSVIMGIIYAFVPVVLSVLFSRKFKRIFI